VKYRLESNVEWLAARGRARKGARVFSLSIKAAAAAHKHTHLEANAAFKKRERDAPLLITGYCEKNSGCMAASKGGRHIRRALSDSLPDFFLPQRERRLIRVGVDERASERASDFPLEDFPAFGAGVARAFSEDFPHKPTHIGGG
jgi:hypothetical protein